MTKNTQCLGIDVIVDWLKNYYLGTAIFLKYLIHGQFRLTLCSLLVSDVPAEYKVSSL